MNSLGIFYLSASSICDIYGVNVTIWHVFLCHNLQAWDIKFNINCSWAALVGSTIRPTCKGNGQPIERNLLFVSGNWLKKAKQPSERIESPRVNDLHKHNVVVQNIVCSLIKHKV